MTKKELLENPMFANMPDTTELVFNTDVRADNCSPLQESNLSCRSEIVGWAKRELNPETHEKDGGDYGADPIYRYYIVIDY